MADPQALHIELLAKIDEGSSTEMKGAYSVGAGPAIDALRQALELHGPVVVAWWSATDGIKVKGWQCEECASRCHSGSGMSCEQPVDAEYPCTTVKVIATALGVATDG